MENDGEDDETMRFPPPFLVPDDPKAQNFGFENDGEDDDYPSNPEDFPKDGSKIYSPDEDSSGFREELADRPDYDVTAESMDSGVIEQELEQEDVQIAESVPAGPNNFILPPLYSANRNGGKDVDQKDASYADVLSEARQELEKSESLYQKYSFENEVGNSENEKNAVVEMEDSARNEIVANVNSNTEIHKSDTFDRAESKFREDVNDEWTSMEKMEATIDKEELNTSYEVERSEFRYDQSDDLVKEDTLSNYRSLPIPSELDNAPRILPTPGTLHMDRQTSEQEDNVFSEMNSYYAEDRTFSQFTENVDESNEHLERTQALSLPSPDIRTVDLAEPSELQLPRKNYENLQAQKSEGFSSILERSGRRKSMPVISGRPFSAGDRELTLVNEADFNSSGLRENSALGASPSTANVGQVSLRENISRSDITSSLNDFEDRREGIQNEVSIILYFSRRLVSS